MVDFPWLALRVRYLQRTLQPARRAAVSLQLLKRRSAALTLAIGDTIACILPAGCKAQKQIPPGNRCKVYLCTHLSIEEKVGL